jgi:hypothetical protein
MVWGIFVAVMLGQPANVMGHFLIQVTNALQDFPQELFDAHSLKTFGHLFCLHGVSACSGLKKILHKKFGDSLGRPF